MNDKLLIKISNFRLDLNSCKFFLDDNAGAVVSFIGVIRNVNMEKKVESVKYHIFNSLANSLLISKCNILLASNKIIRLCVFQRNGVLFVGDINLIVGVTAVDRRSAFLTCSSLVEYIKHHIPIWKKECYVDSTYSWINAF